MGCNRPRKRWWIGWTRTIIQSFDTIVSGMSSIFSGLSDIIQAELEIQTAAITRRYDAELSFAEGNTYKVKKLEREKEQEIARIKNEANRKMFAMQVIQAVAQTATAAINAYSRRWLQRQRHYPRTLLSLTS